MTETIQNNEVETVQIQGNDEKETVLSLDNLKIKRLNLKRSRELANKIKAIIVQIKEMEENQDVSSTAELMERLVDYSEEFIPLITNIPKDQTAYLDYDQIWVIMEKFGEKNKGFLRTLALVGLDLRATNKANNTEEISPTSSENANN